ncbi:dihydrofolate reductase family protein [Demequina sp. SYSU T00039]|uniref:Dihydrofolate reductase family protein n=1 Tax=Demequina lignilytica TaxID=3051663 RepID=A0AAW7M2G0_9MICO|nr:MULTISPECIES: dihydrofolate reductase family protein [unclassified Demequina]MDN4477294.1 dihydrofolate reductase family protein [Demequina sp. SYSU T00039-1]MDN4487467.1 dihydrofolate reductase family protein [Demequina sp. SYSU T00039]
MGRLSIDLFCSLDGVAQAPGAPDEDPSGGFPFGGWQAPLGDAMVGESVMAGIESLDALLLGRVTYDIWRAYWPFHESGPAGAIGRKFGDVPKYVASRGDVDLSWRGSSRVGADMVAEVRELRERHADLHVIGSIDLVQTLLAHDLFDVLTLWVYPVVLGQGKKVFPDGATPATLALLEPPVMGPSGAVQLRYGPTGRGVATGTMEG